MSLLFGALLLLLAGCARASQPNLALACQTTPCTCEPESAGFLVKSEPTPVQWAANGDAYCPAGYVLRRAGEE